MKWFYREHRGSLIDSIKTLKSFNSFYDMLSFISTNYNCNIENITISLYSDTPDFRIGWNRTYLVCINGLAWGFCYDKI